LQQASPNRRASSRSLNSSKGEGHEPQVGGGCIHTIQRGRGAFKNVEGVIKIIDVVAGVTGDPVSGAFAPGTGGNNFLYYARLHFDHDD
jgi:hypothetical protein